MMLFSHDFVAVKLEQVNLKSIDRINSGTHHFELMDITMDDVVKSFQHDWQQRSTGLSTQSEQPEVSIELKGFVIAPSIHQIIQLDTNIDDGSLAGVFKIEFSNQKDQLYYDSNEVDIKQLSNKINLNDLQWTLNNLNDSNNQKVPINWTDIGQLDAWVVRFYPKKNATFNLNSVSIEQEKSKLIKANQRIECNSSNYFFADCLINNKMRYLDDQSIYKLGVSLMAFDSYLNAPSWLLIVMAWLLSLILIFRLAQPSEFTYLLVTAVFLIVVLVHQSWATFIIDVITWMLLLMVLVLFWVNKQVFVRLKNQAMPVWIISGLMAVLLLSLKSFQMDFIHLLPMYLIWAFVQQLLIGPVFSHYLRLHLKTSNFLTACIVGVLFSSIHAPNHMLMIATLFGGVAWSYAWLKYENIYANAISHAILALVFYQVMPNEWLGSARIGVFF